MASTSPITHFGDISIDEFFETYWQKKPLFVPQALQDLPQIDPNILAGFALEQEIESRLIVETPNGNPHNSNWQVHHSPLDDDAFDSLPETHWTLLVQAVDQLDPMLFDLLNQFRFVPSWRLDDIMVSYSVDQGSVGPHFDYYDVFLLQAHGRKRWQIGQHCTDHSLLQSDCDLKILTEFHSMATYDVAPGDLLYIPPQIAHWGVALGESTTYSIGYRAPSSADALTDFCDHIASTLSNDDRYTDANLKRREKTGAITDEDIRRIKHLLGQHLNNNERISDWFARYMTTPKRSSLAFDSPGNTNQYQLTPSSRATYLDEKTESNTAAVKLYINGEKFCSSQELARDICEYKTIDRSKLTKEDADTLKQLITLGFMQ